MLIFDIETAPLPMDELRQVVVPFDPATLGEKPGEFDPSTVKCGNIGGPESEKGKAKIAEARKAHEDAKANWDKLIEQGERAYWNDVQGSGALSPTTGKVVAIGCLRDGHEDLLIGNEQLIIGKFWDFCKAELAKNGEVIGFNSNHFDIPFLIRRSWKLALQVPSLFTATGFLRQNFVDLMDKWKCGDRGARPIKLANLAKFFDLEGKYQDLDGSMFWQLLEVDADSAKEYLRADLRMTFEIHKRMA